VLIDGREVGSVTSAALSPAAGRVRALGYVKRDHAEVGRAVTIEWAGHTLAATITRLAG
jgi:glycine cleavage system aminomethyltransferase T